MNGYTFYTLPLSPNREHFSPATLPSDEAAVAYAAAALEACDKNGPSWPRSRRIMCNSPRSGLGRCNRP